MVGAVCKVAGRSSRPDTVSFIRSYCTVHPSVYFLRHCDPPKQGIHTEDGAMIVTEKPLRVGT